MLTIPESHRAVSMKKLVLSTQFHIEVRGFSVASLWPWNFAWLVQERTYRVGSLSPPSRLRISTNFSHVAWGSLASNRSSLLTNSSIPEHIAISLPWEVDRRSEACQQLVHRGASKVSYELFIGNQSSSNNLPSYLGTFGWAGSALPASGKIFPSCTGYRIYSLTFMEILHHLHFSRIIVSCTKSSSRTLQNHRSSFRWSFGSDL